MGQRAVSSHPLGDQMSSGRVGPSEGSAGGQGEWPLPQAAPQALGMTMSALGPRISLPLPAPTAPVQVPCETRGGLLASSHQAGVLSLGEWGSLQAEASLTLGPVPGPEVSE